MGGKLVVNKKAHLGLLGVVGSVVDIFMSHPGHDNIPQTHSTIVYHDGHGRYRDVGRRRQCNRRNRDMRIQREGVVSIGVELWMRVIVCVCVCVCGCV